jgi:aspartyl-tRNA(Asn)/glutamyl-tRNA(Gln) amidotransferase subunit A
MRTAIECAEAVRRREVSARELVDDVLRRIEERNARLGAFVHVDPELARAEAAEIDRAIARGEDPGPLAGVPFGVKDVDRCAGLPCSRGSLLYKDGPPEPRDSIHVGRLRRAGAVPVGMTAAPEFGTIPYTRSLAWGTARNPWALDRTPGGSSGGSSAAVAAGLVPIATAGDGGGSTRIPAAYTGLVGLKASYGRIPREGCVASQTAVWGALTTTVADAARHLDVAAGPDDRDRTSLPHAGLLYERAIEELDVAGLRAAWSPDLGYAAVEPEVASATRRAAGVLLGAAGLERVDLKVELTDSLRAWRGSGAIDIWLQLEPAHWPERADELLPFNRRGYEQSEAFPVSKYALLLRDRTRYEAEVAAVFDQVDVLLTPTTATPAFAAEGPPPSLIDGRKVDPAQAVPFTMPANLCWNPAISVPAGTTHDGLPIGLQIMGRRHADEVVLRLARIFEQARPWPRLAPGWD